MAGMLPGVELARRRRIHSRQNDHNRYSRCDFFLPERIQPSSTATTTSPVSTMDATALKARTRLEEKLDCFRSRWDKHPDQLPPPVQVRNSSHVLRSYQIQRVKRRREREIKKFAGIILLTSILTVLQVAEACFLFMSFEEDEPISSNLNPRSPSPSVCRRPGNPTDSKADSGRNGHFIAQPPALLSVGSLDARRRTPTI